MADTAVLILAGGEATRFPGKLEHPIEGEPMILRVYRNVRETPWPVYVAGKGPFPPAIEARLDCPLIVDRYPKGGPLAALFSACDVVCADRIFAVAADQPLLNRSLLERLPSAWQPGDEAVVPEHDGQIEPLAALYERSAVLREGGALLEQGRGAMRALVERLHTRFVRLPAAYFLNVNTPADLP